MQPFEMGFLIVTLAWLVGCVGGERWARYEVPLSLLGATILTLHAIYETLRWQMIPAFFVFLLLSMFLLKKSRSPLFFRLAGLIVGGILLGLSYFLASQLPVIELPAPTGPYVVGTTTFSLTDRSRAESLSADPEANRELFVRAWYPAASPDGMALPPAEPLWLDLYSGRRDGVALSMMYLKDVETHSYADLPIAKDSSAFPLVLFNHGLQMFAAQNTLLMEHLASHGYVVLSVAHPYESLRVELPTAGVVLPEFITSIDNFKRAIAWVQETSRPINAALDSIRQLTDRSQRADVMLAAIDSMPALNERVAVWTEDNRFVLDYIFSGQEDALRFETAIDASRVGVMGMSLGGAAAGEFCKIDRRCRAGINVDGMQYGVHLRRPLNVPFLMLYSGDAPGVNDFLLLSSTDVFYEYTVPSARHADFTDLTLVWPILRLYGQLGPIGGRRMIEMLNDVTLDFWDRHLKNDTSASEITVEEYPEIRLERHSP